jgi:uncharacterized protein (TIGR03435 family)
MCRTIGLRPGLGLLHFFAAVSAVGMLSAQPAAPTKRFEVISIRPVQELTAQELSTNFGARMPWISRASVRMPYESMAQILQRAFGLARPRIVAPEWAGSRHYSIEAKLPESASADDVPEMLQPRLSDRFHMTFHREVRNTPVLVLKIGKEGVKAQASVAPSRRRRSPIGRGGVHYDWAVTSAGLAEFLKKSTLMPVIDETGLVGPYLFSFDYYPFGKRDEDGKLPEMPYDDLPTSFGLRYDEALAPLGLRLVRSKVPLENVIIDHLDRDPTEN